jgi:mannose-1-phosphate guanylyltransferase/mannose-6-phosphate isomerase
MILSGGSGTRLWPLSRSLYPKQFLPLNSDKTMFQETVSRVTGDQFAAPYVICNEEHRFLIAEQLRELGVEPAAIVLEPVGRNTAPAATIAALLLAEIADDAVMLLLPSDHVIEDVKSFHGALETAAVAADAGSLVTFGIPPSSPETGYGYIKRGDAKVLVSGCYEVDAFVEKPDRATAQSYLDMGSYDWNSGIFLLPTSGFIDEMKRFEPDTLAACAASLKAAYRDLDFLRLDQLAFESIVGKSIDYAVMEHTEKAAVVPVIMGWNDVGSWSALWDLGDKDGDGNVVVGDAIMVGSKNAYVHSDGTLTALVGVENIVVVVTHDAVMVASREHASEVAKVVAQLKIDKRSEHHAHTRVYRPWGYYQSVDAGGRFQVKRLCDNPGAKLSLQMHHHRAEHWVVVSGTANVTLGEETMLLKENQSTYIPIGVTHALENPGKVPLHIIEVQSGTYLGEDDIVRFEDRYNRVPELGNVE